VNKGSTSSKIDGFTQLSSCVKGVTQDARLAVVWSIFYWGWWMSWAPFVGTFIARISRGRTIREFVLGVLVAPTLVSTLWFTVFGESAILRQLLTGDMAPERVVDTSTSLFILLDGLPWSTLTSLAAVLS
jgi:choline/glycine/proline betaine transport protein